jgi:hypothetical protein
MTIQDLKNNGTIVLRSQIDGTFNGFNTDKIFPLTNGQFWIQSAYKYWYHYAYRAYITIYSLNHLHFISVDGQNEIAQTERLTDVIKDTIVNDFAGWNGNTLFELSNGQIWKQSSYAYRYHYAHRPTAFIYRTRGGYKLMVDGESIDVVKLK